MKEKFKSVEQFIYIYELDFETPFALEKLGDVYYFDNDYILRNCEDDREVDKSVLERIMNRDYNCILRP